MPITEEMIISGFVSKVVNDIGDILKNKIKDADKNRNPNEKNIETRIYQVLVDALNGFSYNEHKKEEIVYDAAESMLREFKDGRNDYEEAVRVGLKIIASEVNDNICKSFLGELRDEICKDEDDILYKEIDLLQGEQILEVVSEGFDVSKKNHEETHEKLANVIKGINDIDKKIGGIKNDATKHYESPIENRAEEYAGKWDKNVFLNDYNKRDENAGENVKLNKIYLEEHLPHYVWKANKEQSFDLKELLYEYIADSNNKKMLLILGQPGIGKSTLITWITAHFLKKRDDIYVYQFASDLKNINWQGNEVLDELLKTLALKYDELENKVLILDGFDEMRTSVGRERILNQIYQGLMGLSLVKKFSLVITCRENFVYELQKVECDYITLQTWDNEQIHSFCRVYEKESKQNISKSTINKIIENKEILGTPLILYMVLALNITIEKNGSIADVYDQIFSIAGGSIYDRCIKNASFAKPHRISEDIIKKQIHQISQRIAFWIFENNSEEAYIPQIGYEKICDEVINETVEKNKDVKRDFLIGNYFKLIKHCEGIGSDDLQFVHRSIYEYFVSEYIFESICNVTSENAVIGELATLLKDGHLSEQILEFIKYKFDRYNRYDFAYKIRDIFQVMLHDSMTYHMQEKCNNIIEREINIFSNMLEIMYLWNHSLKGLNEQIIPYLRYNSRNKLKLKGIKLGNVNLCRVYLDDANLDDANLYGANLEKAEMSGAHLKGALLNYANLQGICLEGANLIGAYLRDANLSGSNMRGADLSGADLINARLINADLERVELIAAKLNKADLRGAKLNKAKLYRADLNGANLVGAELFEIIVGGTYLRGAIFDEKQVNLLKGKCDLSSIKVFIFATEEVISYKEYCFRMK